MEVPDGFLIFFISEGPNSLDNAQALTTLNAPRNLAFVKISSDLQTILSEGPSEEGGYYNYESTFIS
jgi:hypothetical protein